MKLKLISLAIIINILLSLPCREGWGGVKAQQYIPFPTDSAQWSLRYVFNNSQSCNSYQYKMKGDTIINGMTYSKVYYSLDLAYNSPNETLHCFVREDTTKKIFIKYPIGLVIDTTEFMLYDFNLELGDTVTIRLLYYYNMDSLFKFVVSSIAVDQFLTGNRTYWVLDALTPTWGGGCEQISWVEGMGSLRGLLYDELPELYCGNQLGYELSCFWDHGNYVWGGGACDYFTSITERTNNMNLQIYPNPAMGNFNIVFNDSNTTEATIEIRDLLGNLIDKVCLKSGISYTYNVESLAKSVYTVSLFTEGRLIENKKLVII